MRLLALALLASTIVAEDCKPMRIAVLGATGGVGKHVVKLALEQGHTVTAIARDPSKIEAAGDKLSTAAIDMSGDSSDALRTAIKAVILSSRALAAGVVRTRSSRRAHRRCFRPCRRRRCRGWR